MDQEQIMQVQMMEQESNQLNQQMQMVEQNINEMNELKASLTELENHKEGEILVNIGKKIYLPVENKNKKLIVEVGKGNLVEKDIKDTSVLLEGTLWTRCTVDNKSIGCMTREIIKNDGENIQYKLYFTERTHTKLVDTLNVNVDKFFDNDESDLEESNPR